MRNRPVPTLPEDAVIYLGVSKPGGIDGRDASDRGGEVKTASFNKADIKDDGWTSLQKQVINFKEAEEAALKKLTAIDMAVLKHLGILKV